MFVVSETDTELAVGEDWGEKIETYVNPAFNNSCGKSGDQKSGAITEAIGRI